nr:unnamed protein product [Spirometra erinaceieuropaei]
MIECLKDFFENPSNFDTCENFQPPPEPLKSCCPANTNNSLVQASEINTKGHQVIDIIDVKMFHHLRPRSNIQERQYQRVPLTSASSFDDMTLRVGVKFLLLPPPPPPSPSSSLPPSSSSLPLLLLLLLIIIIVIVIIIIIILLYLNTRKENIGEGLIS